MLAMMLYQGFRQSEACGRRWRDWDKNVKPLGSMTVGTQYEDEPLKTDQMRKVPVHRELERILSAWWDRGFELVFRRKPTQDDFIVPNRLTGDSHTKSSLYKALRLACSRFGIRFEGCHLTRHTMITWARRGGAPRRRRTPHTQRGRRHHRPVHTFRPGAALPGRLLHRLPSAVSIADRGVAGRQFRRASGPGCAARGHGFSSER
jgi:integrase